MILYVTFLLFLNLLNVFFHSIGVYLLTSMYPTCKRRIQQIYLINLSLTECLINLLEICRIISGIIPCKHSHVNIVDESRHYTLIVSFTGVSIVYYFDMVYLTFDRLMDVALNIKYPIYWNEKKAKYLLMTTWLIGFLTCLSVSLCYRFLDFSWEDAFFKFFYPPIEFAFIILALATYGFIFLRYRKSRINFPGSIMVHTHQPSTMQIFRKSRFYISLLLIVTFLVFMVAPDLTYLFYGIIYKSESEILMTSCWISYAIANLADAYIYIFVQPNVRRKFWTMFPFCVIYKRRRQRREGPSSAFYIDSLRPRHLTVQNTISKTQGNDSGFLQQRQTTTVSKETTCNYSNQREIVALSDEVMMTPLDQRHEFNLTVDTAL